MGDLEIPYINPITKERMEELHNLISPGPVLVVTHDNPDPDALSSGKALAFLFKDAWGVSSRLFYSGIVARAENKAMLRILTPEWEHMDTIDDLDRFSAIVMVDTQPGAGNNRFPTDHRLNVVIDHHHPIRQDLDQISFVDIRPEIGATVSIVFQYLETMNLVPDTDLATAIFYGVRTDTRALSRDSSPADQFAYFKLLSVLDHNKLAQVEQAGLPRDYFKAFSKGLLSTKVYKKVIVTYQGEVHRPDFSAEMSDLLIRHEDTVAVLCMGFHENVLYMSMRTSTDDLDAGLLIQNLVPASAKAGGHGKSAGGQVPLGNQTAEIVAAEIEKRFLEVMGEEESWQPLLV